MAKKRKSKTAKAQEREGAEDKPENVESVPDQSNKEDTETGDKGDEKDVKDEKDGKTDVTEEEDGKEEGDETEATEKDDNDDKDKDTSHTEETDQPNLFSLADEDDSEDEPSEPVPETPAKTVDEPREEDKSSASVKRSASVKSSVSKSSASVKSSKDRSEVSVPSGDSDSSDSEMEFPKVVSDPHPRPSTPTTTLSHAVDPDQTPVPDGQRSPHVTMDSAASLSTPTDYERVYRRRNTATSTRSRMTVRVDTGDLQSSQSPTPSSNNGISIDTFLEHKELSFRLVTWNVHNRAPPVIEDEHLDSLFLPQSDITVLALQEADPVSGLVSTAQTLNGWKAAVLETLEKANEDGDVKGGAVVSAKEVEEEEGDEGDDETEKSEKTEESEKSDKNDKSVKSEKSEKSGKSDESVKSEKKDKTDRSDESGYESSASGYESSASNNHAYYDPYSNYVVSSNQLIGLLIIVIARKSLMSQISDVRVKSAGTGLLGVWGNKGAVLVEMHIGREATSTQSSKGGFFVPGTRVCFLNCHLSAGDNNVVRRRWEIDQMYRRLELPGRPEWYAKVKENKDGNTGNSSTASLAADNAKYAEYNASSEFLGNSAESSESDAEENESIRGPFSAATTITEMSPNLNGRGGFDDAESVVSADSRAGPGVFDWSADAAAAGGGSQSQRLSRPHENSNLSVVSEAECASSPQGDPRTIIFFLGDLNYRVDKTHEEALEMIEKNDFAGLLAHDQLLKDTRDGRVLAGLNEYPINFPPTYKYVENTVSELDTLRTPSYTDRILSRAWGGCELVQKGYHSHMEYTVSDHKPVSAEFSLSLPLIDFDKRAQIVNNYLKSVGVQENLDRPAVTVSPMSLRVQLAVLTTQTVPLVIHNTGHTVAHWEISQTSGFDDDGKDKTKETSSPSITLSSTTGQLLPGDQEVVEVTFSAAIGAPSCDSFAIVHVKDSKDIFVDTGYDVLPSCFGSDLDYLSRLPNGARNGLSEDGKVVSNMPQEIWKCVDYLWSVVDRDGEGGEDGDRSARPSIEKPGTAAAAPRDSRESRESPLVGLFTSPGDPHLEMDIRDWLDTGSSFNVEALNDNPLGPQSVASQLHLLLASLSQRIIPEYAYLSVPEKTIAAGTGSRIPFMGGGVDNTADVAAHILEAVPNVNANVMIYICSFIRLLVDRKAMTLKTALDVFAPLLMDSPKQGGVSKVWKKSPISSVKLLQHMIDTY